MSDPLTVALHNAAVLRWLRGLGVEKTNEVKRNLASVFDCPVIELSDGMTTQEELDNLWALYREEIER